MYLYILIVPLIALVVIFLIAYVIVCPPCVYLSLASTCATHVGIVIGLYQWAHNSAPKLALLSALLSVPIYVSIVGALFWNWAAICALVATFCWMVVACKRHWVNILSCIVFGIAIVVYIIVKYVPTIPEHARQSGLLTTEIIIGVSLLVFSVATLFEIRQVEIELRGSHE